MELPQRFNIADHFLTARLEEGRGERKALRLDDRTMTYAEVHRYAQGFASRLLDLEVRPEERVVIALPDGPGFVAAFFGVLTVGGVVVMVNPDLPDDAMAAIFNRTRARVVIAEPSGRMDDVFKAAGTVEHQFSVDAHDVPETSGFPIATAATHADDPAVWLFSGGTTGAPKAVVQTHRSFANSTARYAHGVLGLTEDDVTIAVPKLYFGYATGSNLLFPFSVGASSVLFPDKPTPEALYERIDRHGVTILINVPKVVNAMIEAPRALSTLRLATSAGEALPAAMYERWKQAFGVELLDGLGTAEMWHVFLTNRPGEVRPGTVGRAVEGFEVRVRDEEGVDVPTGEAGALWVRGGSRALGYWQDIEATNRTFRGEWVVTGDIVSMDADGYVTYIGRGDDALKVGGKWVLPSEVEGCLLEHEAVAEVTVLGVPNASGLTEPVAFVIPSGAVVDDLAAALKQHVLERLEAHKHPRRVVILEDFPRTHLGKVDRRALRGAAT